ncbi:hypothetical protein ACS0TY_031969 [Phlomoides rotata]
MLVIIFMTQAKKPQFRLRLLLLLLTSILFYFLCPRFCKAQGNGTTISNRCDASGTCGPYGVCDSQGSPLCSCLQGFEPQNNQEWDSGNWTSGCVRRVPLGCAAGNNGTSNGGREDGFLRLPLMMTPASSQRWFVPDNECEGGCLRNCSCVAYGLDSTGCGFWSGPLIGIQKSHTGSVLYIRVPNSELGQKKESKKKIIIILVVVGFVIVSICTYISWKWFVRHRAPQLENASTFGSVDTSVEDGLSQINLEDTPVFKFEMLANATNNFSEASKLGKGGFGVVYKGELVNGREIAVKRLSQASGQGMQEFMNEVVLISKLQHWNLVKLLGCCVENREMMLIYEYMPNKSLDYFLFNQSEEILDWRKRFNIIEGICRGLLYLHRDSRLKIIHRDLKPSNILLDNDWNPKISDFGMARIYGTTQDHVSTVRVVGTFGYMAPEYAIQGRFSEKSDVFSLGVLLLQIATGRRNTSFHLDESLHLLGHVWNFWKEDRVDALIDPRISSSSYRAEVMRCIHIGLLCVQELPKERPSVSVVLSMLSRDIVNLPEPKQSAYSINSNSSQTVTSTSSLNYVSLTTVEGR